ncbi:MULTISPECIES: hypothetical protein [unclassified Bradyrhizobium]|uniref:hypothetical protein n=1 Tax=unclassified Bradyrhizobium TaxID=2631580 RepID=UPI0028E6F618|nr:MULTISPECIES: hypothetical protein [unclassified Bradyrhizobium]
MAKLYQSAAMKSAQPSAGCQQRPLQRRCDVCLPRPSIGDDGSTLMSKGIADRDRDEAAQPGPVVKAAHDVATMGLKQL